MTANRPMARCDNKLARSQRAETQLTNPDYAGVLEALASK
jgi:hypothetical protein